jgi:hypothetical protein
MQALSSMVKAVAPATRGSAKALETAVLTQVLLLEDGIVGCDARLAASNLLAVLPQAAGHHPFHNQVL